MTTPPREMGVRPLGESVRIEPFDGSSVSTEDVIALWAREGVVVGEEAARRANEVVAVARNDDDQLVGVSTGVLRHFPRLGLDMWYVRAFVSESTRSQNAAAHLIDTARQIYEQRYADGTDQRAPGVLLEVQNEGVKRAMTAAVWEATRYTFIGTNERGDHLRVRYFSGATVSPR